MRGLIMQEVLLADCLYNCILWQTHHLCNLHKSNEQ